jgi:hypothetical protein
MPVVTHEPLGPANRRSQLLVLRPTVEAICVLVLAVFIARLEPVRRFYALHFPVWGAHGFVQPATPFAARIVDGARLQIGTVYDSKYTPIHYPGGDVPSDRGACSDVVVRALRHAGVDLQSLIHEDMLRAPEAYPHLSGSPEPDANIDHRRCAIQIRFFARHGMTLTNEVSPATVDQWKPGDVVFWRQPGDRRHVGILSDQIDARSHPLVIHHGGVCIEQDCLTDGEIVGHYRFPRPESAPR